MVIHAVLRWYWGTEHETHWEFHWCNWGENMESGWMVSLSFSFIFARLPRSNSVLLCVCRWHISSTSIILPPEQVRIWNICTPLCDLLRLHCAFCSLTEVSPVWQWLHGVARQAADHLLSQRAVVGRLQLRPLPTGWRWKRCQVLGGGASPARLRTILWERGALPGGMGWEMVEKGLSVAFIAIHTHTPSFHVVAFVRESKNMKCIKRLFEWWFLWISLDFVLLGKIQQVKIKSPPLFFLNFTSWRVKNYFLPTAIKTYVSSIAASAVWWNHNWSAVERLITKIHPK